MQIIDKYKEIIDCNGDYNVNNVKAMAPSQFYDRVGFFVVATTTFPDLEINEALMKFSQLCMSYDVAKKKLSEEQHKSLLGAAITNVNNPDSQDVTITPCCGGGKVL